MLSKILGLANQYAVQPAPPITTEGAQRTGQPKQNFFVNGPTAGNDPYAQHDRQSEQGHSMPRYENGVLIAQKLNLVG